MYSLCSSASGVTRPQLFIRRAKTRPMAIKVITSLCSIRRTPHCLSLAMLNLHQRSCLKHTRHRTPLHQRRATPSPPSMWALTKLSNRLLPLLLPSSTREATTARTRLSHKLLRRPSSLIHSRVVKLILSSNQISSLSSKIHIQSISTRVQGAPKRRSLLWALQSALDPLAIMEDPTSSEHSCFRPDRRSRAFRNERAGSKRRSTQTHIMCQTCVSSLPTSQPFI